MTHRAAPEDESGTAKTKQKRDRNFVKVGSIRIRWYKSADGRTFVDARKYGRKLVSFRDHSEALAEAQKTAIELNAGGVHSVALTGEDRAAYLHAKSEAGKYGLDVTDAVSEWSEARRVIAESGRSMAEVIAAGLGALSARVHLVSVVVSEMLQAKEVHDLQGRYLRGLKSTGDLLSARFPGSIQSVSTPQLEELLDGTLDPETGERTGGLMDKRTKKAVGPRRRNNVLKEIRQIFRFAQKRGYLPYDQPTAAHKVEIIRRVRSNIGVVSPDAMRLYLAHVSEEFLPWLVINAFSGVRTEEIVLTKDAPKGKDPLRWEDFDWHEREIHVRVETSKTGVSRRCPIADNLFEWLAPWRDSGAKGPVCPGKEGRVARPDHERVKFVAAARTAAKEMARKAVERGELPIELDVRYPKNGFRHSYCSYRIALTKDHGKVAYEAGNSIAMQKRNYNNPRPASQAKAWFAIFPDCRPANVVQIGAA